MAKTKVLCPFSKKLCKDCPLFIGRHYHLCDKTKYKGYLGDKKNATKNTDLRGEEGFKMPSNFTTSPDWLTFDKIIESTFDTQLKDNDT